MSRALRHRPVGWVLLVSLLIGLTACLATDSAVTSGGSTGNAPPPSPPPSLNIFGRVDDPVPEAHPDGLLRPVDWNGVRGPGMRAWVPHRLGRTFTRCWTYDAGSSISGEVAVVDGVLYCLSDDGVLHVLDAVSGAKQWTFQCDGSTSGAPVIHDGMAYASLSSGGLQAIDLVKRETAWTAETDSSAEDSSVSGAPNLVLTDTGAIVVFGSHDYNVYGHDARTGERKWTYATDDMVNGAPAVAGTKVFAGGCDAALHVIDGLTGEGVNVVDLGSPVGSSPAIDWPLGFAGTYESGFTCTNLETGDELWNLANEGGGEASAFFSVPALGRDAVAIGGRWGIIYCLDRATGKERWQLEASSGLETGLTMTEDLVLTGDSNGTFYALDVRTGEKVFTFETGHGISASPVVLGVAVIVTSGDGKIYTFNVE